MAVRDLDGIFDNLPPPWRGPRRPGQQRSGALTAADIVAGRSPFGQQSVSQFDDPTISGQLQQAFEHGAERAGLGSQGQGYAGAVGNFIGQSTGLDMPKYLSDAYNYARQGDYRNAVASLVQATPAPIASAVIGTAAKTAVKGAARTAAKTAAKDAAATAAEDVAAPVLATGAADTAAQAAADTTMSAAGNANVAGYRTMADVPDIRNMKVADGIAAAQGNPHLIEAGNRGTGGFYIGAPRSVQSFDDLQALRDRFDARLRESLVGSDWYDRSRAGEAVATGDDPTKNLWSSRMHGSWSQGVNPESETGFVAKEGMGAIAGQPESAMYQNQHDAFMRAIAAGDPSLMQSGLKTDQYGKRINPDYMRINPNAPSATGVNDFRYANEWGFVPQEGSQLRDGDVALNPAQHRWLDYETALAADRANKAKLGGRTDWTGEQVQAAPWVSQKAAALMDQRKNMTWAEAYDEANKTPPDFYPKFAANITTEMQPAPLGVIPGHAPRADLMTPEERQAYADAVRWGSGPGGRDVIGEGAIPGTGVGVPTLPTETGTGLWKGQSNPMEIGRPIVGMNSAYSLPSDIASQIKTAAEAKGGAAGDFTLSVGGRDIPLTGARPGGKDVSKALEAAKPISKGQTLTLTGTRDGNVVDLGEWPNLDPEAKTTIVGTPPGNKVISDPSRTVLDADAAVKAVFGAQQGVGWHKLWDYPSMGGTTGYFQPLDRPATAEELLSFGKAGEPFGMPDVSSTHGGMVMTSFGPRPEPLTVARRNKLEEAIAAQKPVDAGPYSPVRTDASLMEPPWGQQGSGTATDWLIGQTGVTPELQAFMNANPGYGRVAGALAQRDVNPEFSTMIGGARPDIQNLRNVAAADPEYAGQGWLDRIQKYRDVLKSGGTLPKAVAIGGVSTPLFATAGFPAPGPQPQGTSLNSDPMDWARQLQDQRWYGGF